MIEAFQSAARPNWYFNSDSRRKALMDACQAWAGTPWKHRVMVKGEGADCATLLVGVFREMGINPNVPTEYPANWMRHDLLFMIRALRDAGIFEEITRTGGYVHGDVIPFTVNGMYTHMGIYTGRLIIFHTLIDKQATFAELAKLPGHMQPGSMLFRPLEA